MEQDAESGAWVPASDGLHCPAFVTIGQRRAHEGSCAYRPQAQTLDGSVDHGVSSSRAPWPTMPVINVDQVMQSLRTNLARFERVLADRMDLFLAQMHSVLEEQNLHRLRSGASGAVTNIRCAVLPRELPWVRAC